MAKKNDNTLLIVGGLVAAYFIFKPKQQTTTYKTSYLPTSTNPTGSYAANTGNPVDGLIKAGTDAVASILSLIKGKNSSPVYVEGVDVYAPIPVHINDNIDYENGGILSDTSYGSSQAVAIVDYNGSGGGRGDTYDGYVDYMALM